MKQIKFLFLLFSLITFATVVVVAQETKPSAVASDDDKTSQSVKNPPLREELLKRRDADQAMRAELKNYAPGETLPQEVGSRLITMDRDNKEWLKKTIEQFGYPGYSLVGKDGSAAAFLLILRIDNDPSFQRKVLELLQKAVEQKDSSPATFAILTDRVLIAEGKPQKYGTQMNMSDGVLKPKPIEDEANVDKRRAEMGLPTIAESIKAIQSRSTKPNE